jgi:hypothetical protein
MARKDDRRGEATVTCAGSGLAVATAVVATAVVATAGAMVARSATMVARSAVVIAVPSAAAVVVAVPSAAAVVIAVPSGSALSTKVVVATSPVPVVAPTRVPKLTWAPLRERAYLSLSLRSDTQTGQS